MTRNEAEASIDLLYQTWGRSLLRYALAWTQNRETGEDIVQEAFFSLYTRLVAGEEIGNPRAWTLAVVRHLAAKHRRDQVRHPAERLDGWERIASQETGLEADLAALEAFRKVLELLTEREEEVVLLRMESLSYAEIASELGVTTGTVATLLSRALAKIRRTAGENMESGREQSRRRNIGPRSLQ